MEDLFERVTEAAEAISYRSAIRPVVGIVTGSGLGDVEAVMKGGAVVPYGAIPHFPRSTAPGHEGNLVMGKVAECPVAILQGRFHFYEGYSTPEITFPIRLLRSLGARVVVLTNAAGGLNPFLAPGDLMVVADQIHLIPENPLRGIQDDRLGERFPDMSRAYDPDLIRLAEAVALEHAIPLKKGVYAGVSGPSLETPVETRFLRAAGADAVGMSTTPEVIVARSVGLRVLAISVISNVNRPDAMAPILVEEILIASREAAPRLTGLLRGILERLPSERSSD